MNVCRRVKFIVAIDDNCIMCYVTIPEIVTHKFLDCRIAHIAWDFATKIIDTRVDTMNAKPRQTWPWKPLDQQDGGFWEENLVNIKHSFENLALAQGHYSLDHLGGEKQMHLQQQQMGRKENATNHLAMFS